MKKIISVLLMVSMIGTIAVSSASAFDERSLKFAEMEVDSYVINIEALSFLYPTTINRIKYAHRKFNFEKEAVKYCNDIIDRLKQLKTKKINDYNAYIGSEEYKADIRNIPCFDNVMKNNDNFDNAINDCIALYKRIIDMKLSKH